MEEGRKQKKGKKKKRKKEIGKRKEENKEKNNQADIQQGYQPNMTQHPETGEKKVFAPFKSAKGRIIILSSPTRVLYHSTHQ